MQDHLEDQGAARKAEGRMTPGRRGAAVLTALWGLGLGCCQSAGAASPSAEPDSPLAAAPAPPAPPPEACSEVTARLLAEPRPAVTPCGKVAFVGAYVYETVNAGSGCPSGLIVVDVLCPDLAMAQGVRFAPGEVHRLRLGPARRSYSTAVAPPSPRPDLPRFAADPLPPDRIATCESRAEVAAHSGQTCRVIGTYLVRTFAGKGGTELGPWPVLRLRDRSEVMLESLWDPAKRPDPATVRRLSGKTVEATGTVRSAPPKDTPENFAFWCLSPVVRLDLR